VKKNLLLAGLFLAVAAFAGESSKSVVIVATAPSASSPLLRLDTVGACVETLPVPAVSTKSSEIYLKKISGTSKNDYVRVWEAKAHLMWSVRYRLMYVFASGNNLEKQVPVFQAEQANRIYEETFAADPAEGSFYAGSSPRTYYFDSEEKAVASAKKRAEARIAELSPLLCKDLTK